MGFVLGKDHVAARNAGTFGSPTWTTVGNISALKDNMTADKAPATRRASGWFKQYARTLIDLSFTWRMLWDLADTSFAAFLSAFTGGTEIDMVILDGSPASGSHQGPRISAIVTKFDKDENEDGIGVVDVEVCPGITFVPLWFTGAV
jgi:hypothetical protein